MRTAGIVAGTVAGWLWWGHSPSPTRQNPRVWDGPGSAPVPVPEPAVAALEHPAEGGAKRPVAAPPAGGATASPLRDRLVIRREVFLSEMPIDLGAVSRTRIVETDFHYPLVRMEERVWRDARTGLEWVEPGPVMVGDHVLVRLRAGESAAVVAARVARAGLVIRKTIEEGRTLLLEFPLRSGDPLPEVLSRLRGEDDWVETAEPDYLVATSEGPDDPAFRDGSQWGLHNTGQSGGVPDQDMNGPEAWALQHDAPDVTVAIIDTGMRLTHEDLADNLWRNAGESGGGRETNGLDDDGNGAIDDVHGINAINPVAGPGDDNGHGTHVAGIIGAVGNNGKGLAGVAWRVRLLPIKAFNSGGVGAISDTIPGFNYARARGAQVINASWGGSGDSQVLRQAIEACTQAGIVVVVAAGNSGANLETTPAFPAAYALPGMLTVASHSRSGALSAFSNFGSAQLAAPGETIFSAWHESDASYRMASGTSMAAPHVAGMMALLRQRFPHETLGERVNRLLAGGARSSLLADRVAYGIRPDLERSLAQLAMPAVPVLQLPGPRVAKVGETMELVVDVQGAEPLALQWRFNGREIAGATGKKLTLADIQGAQRGSYSVTATNAVGSVYSREIPVAVVGPPEIVAQPGELTVVAGNEATFTVAVVANGASKLTFQWERDGLALLGENGAFLSLPQVQAAQAGTYRVTITSEHGRVTSQGAGLTIVPARAPVVTADPELQSVKADADATFRVAVTGTPILRYQWLKDGVALAGATHEVLTIKRAQEADGGNYSVVVTNSGGMATSRTARLEVDLAPVAPFIVQAPASQAVSVGDGVALTVNAKGTPAPGYQWLRDGQELPNASQPTLAFSRVSTTDEGTYTVRISNAAGTVTSPPARLQVTSSFGQHRWEWRNPLPQGNRLLDVAYLDGSFVAVGAFGTILTSPDAVAWTQRSAGSTAILTGVTSNGVRLVAVGVHGAPTLGLGTGGDIVTSDDQGTTWTPRFSDPTRNLLGVAWGNGRFVAVGYSLDAPSAVIMTSPDGQVWTQLSDPPPGWLNKVTFANGQFFAMGYIPAVSGRGIFLQSPDGLNWTLRDTGLSQLAGIAHGNGTHVAVDLQGGIATSADGVEWTVRQPSGQVATGVAFGRDQFVVLGLTAGVATSADGVDWVPRPIGSNQSQFGIALGADTFVIVGENGDIRTSSDAQTWTSRLLGQNVNYSSVAYGPPGFVAVGPRNSLFSPTGVLWTEHPNGTGQFVSDVIFAENRFVGLSRNAIATSVDGRQWTGRPIPGAAGGHLDSITHGGGTYVAVGVNGRIAASADLATWAARDSPVTTTLYNVAYGNGEFVAVGTNGVILTSPDSLVWTVQDSGTAEELRGVAHNGTRWVAVGLNNVVLHSTDARRWTDSGLPRNWMHGLGDVIYAFDHFIAVGSGGAQLTSPDGITWTQRAVGWMLLITLCAGDQSLVAVGDRTIIQSAGFSSAQEDLAPRPIRQTAAVGREVRLEIDTVGLTGLSFQWLKDGEPIPGAQASTLSLGNAQFSDAGSYSVVVRDSIRATTTPSAYVAVVGLTQPASPVAPGGGGGLARIAAPAAFNWTVGTIDPWIRMVDAPAGAGAADVRFDILPNSTGRNRRGSLVVAGQAVAVDQAGLAITTQPDSRSPKAWGSATFAAAASGGAPPGFQWQRNGHALPGATAALLTLDNLLPENTGIYTAVVTNGETSLTTRPVILGLVSAAKSLGAASEVGADIVHPNGNRYDQVLLGGAAAAVTADPGQVTRLSYVDLTDDIVQVEFSGAGTLSLILDHASGPAPPVNYVQPGVNYMKGHAGIVIAGANETTHVAVFSVGRANAVNQGLFRDSVDYDAIADLAFIAILSDDGKFGGIRSGNAAFSATEGLTGIYAPGVRFTAPVVVHDITAFAAATPTFVLGAADDLALVTGGDFLQANEKPVQTSGLTRLRFVEGASSHGHGLPARTNRGRFEQDGVDITEQIVVNP